MTITAWRLDTEALDTAYRTLLRQTMELTSVSDRKITGTINVTKPGNLVFSIAREDGWTAFIDGQIAELETFAEAFLSFPLTEGCHTVELVYTTPGLKTGIIISLAGLLLAGISIFFNNQGGKRCYRQESKEK